MPTDKERIETAVTEAYGPVKDFWSRLVIEHFLQGSVHYCEFKYSGETVLDEDKAAKKSNEPDDFCYAFANSERIEIFDDGAEVLKGLQAILEKRRSFLQRLNEFSLVEMIG